MNSNFKYFFFIFITLYIYLFTSCKEDTPSSATTENSSPPTQEPVVNKIGTNTTPLVKLDANLKGAQRCVSCHAKEVKDWDGSHHEMAMKPATAKSVLGDFNNAEFTHKGTTSRFYKKGDIFYVSTKNAKGELEEFEITYTFGIHPLQQYIVEFPNGRKQCLHTAWDNVKKKWYHLYDIDIKHGEWLNWTGGSQNWNSMCADCHSTELKKNYDPKKDEYHTTYKNINVSCEACHGPSEQHILAKLNPTAKLNNGPDFLPLTLSKTPVNKTEVEKCARCHSRRGQLTSHYDHKGELMDHYLPEILRDDVYHEDGQILDEVYVYGSFVQSKMYHQQNVRCSNCHDPHTTKLKFQGNALCMQCHNKPFVDGKQGQTISNFYDSPKHHFHKQGSTGAQCIECHMAGKHYMGIDFRRDHSFRIPRPDQSVKHGTPNACNTCHKDKDAKWAEAAVVKNYGDKRKPHFSDLLLAGRDQKNPNPPKLIELAMDTTQPPIARATALWILQNFPYRESLLCARELLQDKEPIVRYHAMAVFNQFDQTQRKIIFSPLLLDKVRAVRMQAASNICDIKFSDLEPKYQAAYTKAIAEYQDYMKFNADSSNGQMNISIFHMRRKDMDKAKEALRRVIKIDNHFNQAKINLAHIYAINGEYKEAEKLYLDIIKLEPSFHGTWYNLGLLYSEMKSYLKATEAFKQATIREPRNLRIYYNRALCLQKIKKYFEAEKVFYQALSVPGIDQRDPNAEALVYALIILQLDMKNMQKATETIGTYVQIYGQKGQYMNSIKQSMGQLQKELKAKENN